MLLSGLSLLITIISLQIICLVPAALAEQSDVHPHDRNFYRIVESQRQTLGSQYVKTLTPVLSEMDEIRYQKIFELQKFGNLNAAKNIIQQLDNDILIGHVLAQKYLHPTAHRSTFKELTDWLKLYADHPDARRLYRLALKRRPKGKTFPNKPVTMVRSGLSVGISEYKKPPIIGRSLDSNQRKLLSKKQRTMRSRIRRGWPTGARTILMDKSHTNLASKTQFNYYQSLIAWSYYLHNKDELALTLASSSAKQARSSIPDSDWTAGLAAWRLARYEKALTHFSELAKSSTAAPWLKSSGAYWASRAELRLGYPENVTHWLKMSIKQPRTFYGLLAMRALGLELAFDWNSSILTKSDAQLLEEIEGTKRIRALAQIGQDKRAIREIHSLWTKGSLGLIRILPKLANTLGFVETQMMLGKQLSALDDTNLDSAVFPLPNWIPLDGYKIDRALVFALIRQESKFKAKSRSRRGARGLMQLMPRTAKFVAKRSGIVLKDNNDLNDPVINISLGQSYLEYLLTVEVIGDNFFFLLCAYNAGPGNLRKWLEKTNFKDDPLLFAESIRSRETRQFIKSVSTNYWIYRSQLSQRTPSLNATVSGNWPKYLKQE